MKDEKEINVSVEKSIDALFVNAIRDSLNDAIKTRLCAQYGSPLDKVLSACIDRQQSKIAELFNSAADAAVSSEDFRKEINDAFAHKLARVLVSKFEGEVEKRASELRADPTFRAKVTLAIEKAVKDQASL